MRTAEREIQMNLYFTALPAKLPPLSAPLKIAAGLIFTGIAIGLYYDWPLAFTILAIATTGIGSFWLRSFLRTKNIYRERPASEKMINWLIADLQTKVKPRAAEALSLNINQLKPENFILIPYPVFWGGLGVDEKNLLRRDTGNKSFIYNYWKVQVIALTRNYLSYYICDYDWLTNSLSREFTNEYFYADISSVKTDVEEINKKLAGKEQSTQLPVSVIRISNLSSDSLQLITDIPDLNYPKELMVDTERIIQILRLILRRLRQDKPTDIAGNTED